MQKDPLLVVSLNLDKPVSWTEDIKPIICLISGSRTFGVPDGYGCTFCFGAGKEHSETAGLRPKHGKRKLVREDLQLGSLCRGYIHLIMAADIKQIDFLIGNQKRQDWFSSFLMWMSWGQVIRKV